MAYKRYLQSGDLICISKEHSMRDDKIYVVDFVNYNMKNYCYAYDVNDKDKKSIKIYFSEIFGAMKK